MNPNYRTDVEGSVFKLAGPHLIERTFDSPAQSVTRIDVIVTRPFTVAVAIPVPAIDIKPEPAKSS